MSARIVGGCAALCLALLVAGYFLLPSYPRGSLPVAVPVQAPASVPRPSAPGPTPLSTEAFRQLAQEVMQALPNEAAAVARTRSGEPIVIEAALALGKLAKASGGDAGLEAEAVTFFRECAVSTQHLDVVRALCLFHFRYFSRKTGQNTREGFASPSLRSLADKLSG